MTHPSTKAARRTSDMRRARNGRSGALWMGALGLLLCAPSGADAQAHVVAAGRGINAILNRDRSMTAIETADAPRSAPVARATPDDESIRPFHVSISENQLTELRRRIRETQWPEKETVTDQSQGVPLATMQELARYWATDYDWRKVEAKLNALPQFITEIDGLDIHFIHVRSKHENALPLIVSHGWPGSIIEQLKIIGPL